MTSSSVAHATSSLNDWSLKQLLGLLWDLKLREANLQIFTVPNWTFILWLFCTAVLFLLIALFIASKVFQLGFFFSAFQRIKFKKKDIARSLEKSLYLEIIIPKNSQATAFQVQQKIFKTLHSVYSDPIEGVHAFSPTWYFFQKLYRFCKVLMSKKVFFTLQIFGEYPDISFRLNIPSAYYDRIEKALYDTYPGAEIIQINKEEILKEIRSVPKSYLSYGQSKIEGEFFHRLKTFKDVSSDPVDSLISTMEGLKQGEFMAYTVYLSPASHFFNQTIHFLLDEEERKQQGVFNRREGLKQQDAQSPDLLSQVRTAMIEKMKSSLFQIIISYWTVLPTKEESQAKLANIQSILTQVSQKNMNTLKHERLFTTQIEMLDAKCELEGIVAMHPILKRHKFRYFPLFPYKNHGQIVSDGELYSLWHLPNFTMGATSSVKVSAYKKLPASHAMRALKQECFVKLGASNFRSHEGNPIGIPSWEDMKKHVYILGGTGSGKSETLKTILNDLLRKDEKEKTALLIVDPKNDFATDLLTMIPEEQKGDVVYSPPQGG